MDVMTNEQQLEHAHGRIHVLEERIASLENVQVGLLERGIQLEQLCRDMWEYGQRGFEIWEKVDEYRDRMDELGLLEGGDK